MCVHLCQRTIELVLKNLVELSCKLFYVYISFIKSLFCHVCEMFLMVTGLSCHCKNMPCLFSHLGRFLVLYASLVFLLHSGDFAVILRKLCLSVAWAETAVVFCQSLEQKQVLSCFCMSSNIM